MVTKLLFARDEAGYNCYGTAFSNVTYSATLAATTDTSLTVPEDSANWLAVFSVEPAKLVWVALNTAAAAPVGAPFAANDSELISNDHPMKFTKIVKGGDVLHFFSQTGTANIGVALYAITP